MTPTPVVDALERVNITPDPAHVAALDALPTLADKIRYAAENAPDHRTATVRAWLDAHDVQTRRSYASQVLSGWRRVRGLADTGEQPTMTPELLAELDAQLDTDPTPTPDPMPEPTPAPAPDVRTSATADPDPVPAAPRKPVPIWPVVIMCLGAFVAVWSGWVGLGELTGFGEINLLPGIAPAGGWATINSAITLPIGVEAYAAYALWVWLSGRVVTRPARRFAMWSALGALAFGALGQAAYHLMTANPDLLSVTSDGTAHAPVWTVVLVSCLPVAVLGMGAALAHMVRSERTE